MQIDGASLEEARQHIRARPLLVIKMLTPAVGLPKCTGYCGFFEHRGEGNARLFTKISVSECLFFFFSSYNIVPRAYEKPSSTFLLCLFFFSANLDKLGFGIERFFRALRFLLRYSRESRDVIM